MTMPAPVILFRCVADPPHENDIVHERGEIRCGYCGERVIDLRETKLCTGPTADTRRKKSNG